MLRRVPLLAVAALSVLLLAGCGGGGGGGGSHRGSGKITYQTVWTGTQGGPQGVSERVSVYTTSGQLVTSQILNKGAATTDGAEFDNLDPGAYQVVAELNSATNFTGTTTGSTSTILQVGSGTTTFTTKVGDLPTSLNVTPESASLSVNQTQQFAATAFNASNQAVFLAPGNFTWNVNGGVATVSSTGVVTATNVGQGSVVVMHTVSGLTDAAALTVTAFNTQHSKWTVLVYLNAANDLNEFGDLNFNQIERVAGNADVRFVVQWKQALIPNVSDSPSFIGTRRYLAKKDSTDQIKSELVQDMGGTVDMGDWHTLRDFITWGQTFFPADRYVLVVWNHGNGWHRRLSQPAPTRGVSYDDDTGNWIDTWELGLAMGSRHVDIFAWDASLMQMIEVNEELEGSADLIVGSEESPPGAGYPYDKIFQTFVGNPDAPSLTLAKSFVTKTLEVPSYATEKITQSVLEAEKIPTLASALDQLAQALIQQKQADPAGFTEYIQAARNNARAYSQSTSRTYRDIVGLTLELDKSVSGYVPSAAIKQANQAVRAAAAQTILFEGHNAQSPGSNGLSIDFSPAVRFANYGSDYANLTFAQTTHWDDWLAVAP